MNESEILNLIYKKHYNVVRLGTWFAVSNKCVPTSDKDSQGYDLNLANALQQAEKVNAEK